MRKIVTFIISIIPFLSWGQDVDSIIGRPYKSFETMAFCSYDKFHPTHYLTDNNWEILCAFTQPGKMNVLDSLGISYNKSQIQLLRVGDLLELDGNGIFKTKMPIFGKNATDEIRKECKEFADSIYPIIEPNVKKLVSAFNQAGYSKQVYSLIFSYLLDGYIWDNERLASPKSCEGHGTWTGAYWSMFEKRNRVMTGTNSYGSLYQNWTDDLGYWMNATKMLELARAIKTSTDNKIDNVELIEYVKNWGIVDDNGNILIPILHRGNGDNIDLLCKSITDTLSKAVKQKCLTWGASYGITSNRLAEIIFYHEVMWDLLDILETKSIITMPAILKGEEVSKEHKADNLFIVIDDKE